jgi:hypothetical protein
MEAGVPPADPVTRGQTRLTETRKWGGYIAARLATDRPLSHAVVLGAIGFVLSAIGIIATMGQSEVYGPVWYSLLVTATALPCSIAGGKLCARGARA